MPTLFQRVFAYSRNKKLPILTVNQRSQLGQIVLEKYKVSGIQKRYTRVKSKEYDFDGMVIHYPSEFREGMDSCIKEFYDKPPKEPFVYIKPEITVKIKAKNPTPIPVKKRRKITKKGELVYSTKNQ